MTDEPERPDARPFVLAALALAAVAIVLIAIGSAASSKGVLIAAAVFVAAALVPILWWRAVLIEDFKRRHSR